ncbi:hypothetical protein AOQ84DRAFT_356070 [Glonium stellatum]|uniref:Uncharacterized protein n=1 Tax=Glonium stellatum TaxID=574774 RepID=A0A8E2EV71_9PEZI|nr:hypothetical protein AOQ84DRAFT_356070 [Glonium stellatum]
MLLFATCYLLLTCLPACLSGERGKSLPAGRLFSFLLQAPRAAEELVGGMETVDSEASRSCVGGFGGKYRACSCQMQLKKPPAGFPGRSSKPPLF